jgi:ABC-type uncharacterized transport system auxiliary subunit
MKINLNQTLLTLTIFLCAAAMVGCSNTAKPVSTAETNKSSVSVEKKDKLPESPTNRDTPNVTASSSEKIGVPECDDYIEKYEACITGKVPEAARAAIKSSFEQTRKTWKDLAANPQTKNSLASVCKMSKDAVQKSMEAYKCDW